tara:strand:+ start:256 stop:654 length:399 start_codon:yes stop_codon:yes gene_type:complete
LKYKLANLFYVFLTSLFVFGCTPHISYEKSDCDLFSGMDPIRANPAGALNRQLELQVAFRLCPPKDGLEEIKRKRIELKHHLLEMLSAKSEEELKDPLRIEIVQQEIKYLINNRILKKGKAVEVFVTSFELR